MCVCAFFLLPLVVDINLCKFMLIRIEFRSMQSLPRLENLHTDFLLLLLHHHLLRTCCC